MEDDFNHMIQRQRLITENDAMSFCHLNIRSAVKNLNEFSVYLDNLKHNFSVIGISETLFQEDNCSNLYTIKGYRMVEKHRQNKRGGGVGVFVKNNQRFKERADLSIFDDNMESVFIEIDKSCCGFNKDVIIGVIYRPPNKDVKSVNELMTTIIDKVNKEKKICYFMGDYNIDLLKHESHPQTSEFLDIMYSNNFIPVITRPTIKKDKSGTSIDNIFTYNLVEINHSIRGLFRTEISDHLPIFMIHKRIKEKENTFYSMKRKFNPQNKNRFKDLMAQVDWTTLYNNQDTNSAYEVFHNKINKIYNEAFPKIKIKNVYYVRKPWLTYGLKKSVKIKNKLYAVMCRKKTVHNENTYKNYRNKVHELLKNAERSYYNEQILTNKD